MTFLTTFTINILILLITLILILYLYFKWSYTYWSRRGVTTPLYSFPLGNLNDVALARISAQEIFKQSYKNYKSRGLRYFGYYLLHQPVLVVLDIELIKSIMIQDFAHFTNHGLADKADFDTFGGHLFSLTGAEWKKRREILSPLFTSAKLKMMFSTIETCSIELKNLIDQAAENTENLDIKDVASRYTVDVIALIAFGIKSNSLRNPNSDFLKYGKRAFGQDSIVNKLRLAINMLMPVVKNCFKISFYPPKVTKFFVKIVEDTIKYREEKNVVRKDFMQLMIQLKNNVDISVLGDDDCFTLQEKDGSQNTSLENENDLRLITIQEIVAESMLFFIAGYDTSSTTITFCMYELAFDKDIQDRLRDEIKTVLDEHQGKLSYDAIMEMTYMDKCIKETLRKYPIMPYLFRGCTKEYQVPNSDLIIEKDMVVLIPINEIQYDPEYYPSPEKFDPERFSHENLSARNSFTWLPFGEGPRLCLGTRLAMIEMKIALATLLSDFRYSLDSKTAYPLKRTRRSLILAAEGGIWLNVEKILK